MSISSKDYSNRPNNTSVLSVNFKIMAVGGMWPPERRSLSYLIYSFYTFFSLFCLSSCVPASLAALYHNWGDLKNFAMNGCILVMTIMANIKAILFLKKMKYVYRLVNTLDDVILRQRRRKSHSATQMILDTAHSHAWRKSVFFFLYAVFTVNLWNALPILEMHFSDSWEDRLLPIVAWYPFSINDNRLVYGLIYAKLSCSNSFSCFVVIGMDLFFVSVMIHTKALLKIVNIRYSELRLRPEADNQDDSYNDDGGREELHLRNLTNSHKRMYRDLCKCIEHHEDIIKFVEQLEDLLNKMLLPQFVAGIIVICLTLLQFTTVQPPDVLKLFQFKIFPLFKIIYEMFTFEFKTILTKLKNVEDTSVIKFIMYFFAIMFQMFIYCWHAHGIMEESNLISFSAYSCEWPDASPIFKKSLRIVMCRSQKPLTLTAGKFYGISRETFVKLINASYSFYAVLRQLNDR